MGNVSAACRLDDNKCTVVSLEIEREDWRIGGLEEASAIHGVPGAHRRRLMDG